MDERPNILVITSDQHHRGYISHTGHKVARTPSIDRLCREGMRFTNAYCAAPLCGPSRMSFLTSRTPSRNRVWENGQILSSAIPTFAHALGTAGYETLLFGRMDIRGVDQRHGFEHRPVAEHHSRHPGGPIPGDLGRDPRLKGANESFGKVGRGRSHRLYFDDGVTDGVVSFLQERGCQVGGRPFAAVVGLWLPHPPLIAPGNLIDGCLARMGDELPEPEDFANQPISVQRLRRKLKMMDPVPPARAKLGLAAYAALVEYLDTSIGRILTALEAAGLDKNTLVIYTSDHGEMALEHGLNGKSIFYEAAVTVPLVARLPGVIQPGSTAAAIANLMDIGPTLADFGGAAPMPNVDGRSLAPFMRGQPADAWRNETISEFVWEANRMPGAMIRADRYKLWTFHGDPDPVLFDLESDPGERHDLVRSAAHAGIRADLLARLQTRWAPEVIARESAIQEEDGDAITAWGRKIQPPHPDTPPALPREADDFELL